MAIITLDYIYIYISWHSNSDRLRNIALIPVIQISTPKKKCTTDKVTKNKYFHSIEHAYKFVAGSNHSAIIIDTSILYPF